MLHKNKTGLTKEKKEILRKVMGAASSETILLNDIRDEYKNSNFFKQFEFKNKDCCNKCDFNNCEEPCIKWFNS